MGMDGVELVMAIEEEFDCQISDAVAASMTTPRVLIDWLFAAQDRGELFIGAEKPSKPLGLIGRFFPGKAVPERKLEARRYDRDEIRDRVFEIITEQLGVKRVWEDADFVRDLGLG